MGRFFTELEKEIIQKSKEVCENALMNSAGEMVDSIRKNICYKVSDQYYRDYSPKNYKRTRDLMNVWNIRTFLVGSDGLKFTLDIDYELLEQHYSKSHFHQDWRNGNEDLWISRDDPEFNWGEGGEDETLDNGLPVRSWIVQNFIDGIHPCSYLDKKTQQVVHQSVKGHTVVESMYKYVDKYRNKNYLSSILIKHLKEECKKYK